LPPKSRVHAAPSEIPFASRGETLFAIALLTALSIWVASNAAAAHDFWIEPAEQPLASTGLTSVALFVGDPGWADPFAYDATHAYDFRVLGPLRDDGVARVSRVVGVEGALPAGRTALREPGVHVISYRSTRNFIQLEAERFEPYLKEEGLDHVLASRAAAGQTDAPGRELYSRCAKSIRIVSAEDDADEARVHSGHDRVLGLTLELIPEAPPLALDADSDGALALPLRLLFRGEPLADALVHGHAVDAAPLSTEPARTDAEGRVLLHVPAAGRWVFASTHMLATSEFDGDGVPFRDTPAMPPSADWESLWASLSMTVQARAPRVVASLPNSPDQELSR